MTQADRCDYELFYWRNERRQECDYVLRKRQSLVTIEVKSGSVDRGRRFEKFKEQFADNITSAFIVGPQALPLEEFFVMDLKSLFKRKQINL